MKKYGNKDPKAILPEIASLSIWFFKMNKVKRMRRNGITKARRTARSPMELCP